MSSSFQSLSAARPVITVYEDNAVQKPSGITCALPAVYKAPIRPDIVTMIHNEIAKNHRQPYSVNVDAGELEIEMSNTLARVRRENALGESLNLHFLFLPRAISGGRDQPKKSSPGHILGKNTCILRFLV